jgi:hypothetical protein
MASHEAFMGSIQVVLYQAVVKNEDETVPL